MFRLQDYTHGNVAEMRPADLRAEVRCWRDSAAIRLMATVELVEEAAVCGSPALFDVLRRRLRSEFDTLVSVLDGPEDDRCALCSEPIEPGAPVLREVNEGEVHAECLGDALPGEGPLRPGDKVQCDAEGIVGDDDEPVEGGDGILIARAYEPVFSRETFLRYVGAAEQLLERSAV